MARQHSLGEFEQKLTGGTLRQNLETSLGFGDDLTSGFHRLIERSGRIEQSNKFGTIPGSDDLIELRPVLIPQAIPELYQRKCEFSQIEIPSDGLTRDLGLAHQIQYVVDDLEGDPHLDPEQPQRLADFIIATTEHGSQVATGSDERSGLPADNVEIDILIHLEIVLVLELDDLALAQVFVTSPIARLIEGSPRVEQRWNDFDIR